MSKEIIIIILNKKFINITIVTNSFVFNHFRASHNCFVVNAEFISSYGVSVLTFLATEKGAYTVTINKSHRLDLLFKITKGDNEPTFCNFNN